MLGAPDEHLLEALLDSWDRNNTIMLNLLRALPEGGLEVKAMQGSPSVAQQFMHIHHERLVSVFEEAPEFARTVPEEEWRAERDRDRIAQMLTESAVAVGDAVRGRVQAGGWGDDMANTQRSTGKTPSDPATSSDRTGEGSAEAPRRRNLFLKDNSWYITALIRPSK